MDFDVEKILKKRSRKGRVEYYLKWKGYNKKDNSCKPIDNLGCPDFIAEFEKQRKKKRQKTSYQSVPYMSLKGKEKSPNAKIEKKSEEGPKLLGFDHGLIAENIIGATDAPGELMFLMAWKDSEVADLIPAKLANVKCPQVVIEFYERQLTFRSPTNENWESD